MTFFQAIIIAIVEGITEFLPVSSTGHIIITNRFLGIKTDDFVEAFTIAVQAGAILAVVALYWKKFLDLKNWRFYLKLLIGILPAVVIALAFEKKIDALINSATTVGIALLGGGIVLIFIDRFFNRPTIKSEKEVSYLKSFLIGMWQCLALIPGMSRSASSIIGGMQQKLTRAAAAEFSFFLGVPTLLGATVYKLFKYYKSAGGFTSHEVNLLLVSNLVSFVVAIFAVKFFIESIKKYGFKMWGYYRVLVGLGLLIMIYFGYVEG